jgi:hypothetical protein
MRTPYSVDALLQQEFLASHRVRTSKSRTPPLSHPPNNESHVSTFVLRMYSYTRSSRIFYYDHFLYEVTNNNSW